MADPRTRDVERWFMRRGFTALLDGTSMRRRRAARFARTLAAVFVAVMVIEVPRYASNLWVTLAISVVVVVLTWVAGNLIRRRPAFALPDRVTALDRAVFLFFPGLVVLATPHDVLSVEGFELPGFAAGALIAVGLVVGQLVLLGVLTLLAYSGVIALGPWLWRRVVSSFMAGGTAIGRTLPLLLGVVGFLFFTGELWQALGGLSPLAYLLAALLFVGLSWLFLHTRGLDLDALARFDRPGEVSEQVAGTPLEGGDVVTPAVCPLTLEQRKNLRLVGVIETDHRDGGRAVRVRVLRAARPDHRQRRRGAGLDAGAARGAAGVGDRTAQLRADRAAPAGVRLPGGVLRLLLRGRLGHRPGAARGVA